MSWECLARNPNLERCFTRLIFARRLFLRSIRVVQRRANSTSTLTTKASRSILCLPPWRHWDSPALMTSRATQQSPARPTKISLLVGRRPIPTSRYSGRPKRNMRNSALLRYALRAKTERQWQLAPMLLHSTALAL